MKIKAFRIENFRNIQLAIASDLPDFVVIGGVNGCGKSAILEALVTCKECVGTYHSGTGRKGRESSRMIRSGADLASICMDVELCEDEYSLLAKGKPPGFPRNARARVNLLNNGGYEVMERGGATALFPRFDTSMGLGFFDYIGAERRISEDKVASWAPNGVTNSHQMELLMNPLVKYKYVKSFLAELQMRDLHELQRSLRSGNPCAQDSLTEIKTLFNDFFDPMEFKEVRLDVQPFQFIISTPKGEIELDDLSSGEKEIVNNLIRFIQLRPRNSIVFFDEPDLHLHPYLAKRYLRFLRDLSAKGKNQFWITTHSPEMMAEAGANSLYSVTRHPLPTRPNQFYKVSSKEETHNILAEVMGSRGIIAFDKHVIFIEGDNASADKQIYDHLYPSTKYHISFIPVGNSYTITKTAERINQLLTESTEYQQYSCIADGDSHDPDAYNNAGDRYFRLPVYHVENFLLDEELIYRMASDILGADCSLSDAKAVKDQLIEICLDQTHLKSLAGAIRAAELGTLAAHFTAQIQKGKLPTIGALPDFPTMLSRAEAIMRKAVSDGTWKKKCKGRDILNQFCGKHGLKYEHFRNLLIRKMKSPPAELDTIMKKILGQQEIIDKEKQGN